MLSVEVERVTDTNDEDFWYLCEAPQSTRAHEGTWWTPRLTQREYNAAYAPGGPMIALCAECRAKDILHA